MLIIYKDEFTGSIHREHHQELDPLLSIKTNMMLKPIVNVTSLLINQRDLPVSFPHIDTSSYSYGIQTVYIIAIISVVIIVIISLFTYCYCTKSRNPNVITVQAVPAIV